MKLTIQDALEKDKSQYPHALLRSIPSSYAFSSSSDHCLPGFLVFALGVRLNICHSLEANRSKSLLLISPFYFFVTLLFFSEPLCDWTWMRLRDCLEESCSDSPPVLRVLLLLPAIQRDAEGVKLRCVWCWVRAGYERVLKQKRMAKMTKPNLRKMSESPISLIRDRLADDLSGKKLKF